jgi:hypothetical protein
MKKIFFLFAVLTAVIISSCKKDGHNHETAPEINFIEPADQQVFSLSDTVRIRATINHPEEMHGYMLIVENLISNAKDTMIDLHDHSMNISIDTSFFPNVSEHTHFQIRVVATDHDELTISKFVTIHVDH